MTRCNGRDRRVEEDGGRQTGRGRCRKINVELETSAMQTDTVGVASSRGVGWSSLTRDTASCRVVSGDVRGELSRLFLCQRPSSIAPRWVKGGRQELECTQSGKESVQLPTVHHCCGANRGRIVSLQSTYSSPFTNLRPSVLRNFGPERKHACSFYTNDILLRHHAHPCLLFHVHLYMGLYTYYKHFQDKY